jgi:hypothetical protein
VRSTAWKLHYLVWLAFLAVRTINCTARKALDDSWKAIW